MRRDTAVAVRPGTEAGGVEIEYLFGSTKATQVHVDLPLSMAGVFSSVSFELQGDGTGNQIELWLNGMAGKWYRQGDSAALGATAWSTVRREVAGTPTDIAARARFVVVQKAGASKGVVRLRRLVFAGAPTGAVPVLGHVFGEVPEGLPYLDAAKPFRVERRRVDDRAVVLIDGDPLFCVLDAHLDKAFLESARQAGVNTLALDLYWRDLEPRPGYGDWDRLEAQIKAYGRCGFALIFLVNIHQPAWVMREVPDEPTAHGGGCVYPNAAVVRDHFSRFLRQFVKRTLGHPNVLAYGLSAGGEADGDFPEVNGDVHPWRRSPTLLDDFREGLRRKYQTDAGLRAAWETVDVSLSAAVPVAPLGPYNQTWRDMRPAAHDWREYVDRFWIDAVEWQARVVKKAAPAKLTLVRLSWPVFQTFNPFLARRESEWLDMLQVKDAVPTWEQATPIYLRSRVAMFLASTRGTDIVNFPEIDVGHNRGAATSADIARFLPAVAEFSGGVWYYRDVKPDQWSGVAEAARQVKSTLLRARPEAGRRVAVFYGERYANWVQNHSEYDNEDSLAGTVRVLDSLGVPFDIVSEDCLEDLARYRVLIVPNGMYMLDDVARRIGLFLNQGGRVLAVEDVAEFDLRGRQLDAAWKVKATLLPSDAFRRLRPKEEGITLGDAGRATVEKVKEFLKAAGMLPAQG
ncbi:MAG: hypothetical protein A3K19_32980 [Lentisphaerae bacterium RIFOXYB12_FULL_65_16]|nr:MAG: hypothetical protein A3K18_15255 [Lentisphaerae bacterium RIFOXYA12_64_32]OGV87050.1 MAG: hypothetical protein A3K19_32980 [Lentisphaerae bacterium RIFOXYB12_FULL_65_16]